ncbi:MAG: aquaporin Z [Granulosicoccus sp.]|jgi:aquaporin Z
MTAAFLFIILGVTDTSRSATGGGGGGGADQVRAAGFAPVEIGFGLTLIHLISILVSNTSVNPARSTGPALISMDGTAIVRLWVF